jgi:alpha-glucosidase (family GH31 glycosyl hydrolase)
LLPYIIEQAERGAALGLPLVRHLVLEYSTDRNVLVCRNAIFVRFRLLCDTYSATYVRSGNSRCLFPDWSVVRFLEQGEGGVEGRVKDMDVPGLETMPIWVRGGAMVPWAGKRLRTYSQVGKVEKVEICGDREELWICGNGKGGSIEVAEGKDERWICKGRDNVEVMAFDSQDRI